MLFPRAGKAHRVARSLFLNSSLAMRLKIQGSHFRWKVTYKCLNVELSPSVKGNLNSKKIQIF